MKTSAFAATLALVASAGPVFAGGMVLDTRGVRPTARGGAFVAGADDLGAFWFNPAGLAHLADAEPLATEGDAGEGDKGPKDAFLFDMAWVSQSVSYTRVDSGYNAQPTVSNQAPGLAVPSIAYAHRMSSRLVIGGGLWAPYAGLTKFDTDGPARYSSIDLSESLLLVVAAGVGYRVNDSIRVGATVQNMSFLLSSSVMFAGCPGQTLCAPEDPEMDAQTKVTQNSYFVPSASVGAQIDFTPRVTFGASFQAPYKVTGSGKVQTVLPSSGFYNGASVEGDRADVSFTLPAVIRAGLEARPGHWRMEAAIDYEMWSEHKEMTIEPKDVRIVGAPGVGTYELGPLSIPRQYKNSIAASFGVEGQLLADVPLRVLAGYSYETAAAPTKYLSVLTVDGDKHAFALGASYKLGRWKVDVMASYFKMADRTVESCDTSTEQTRADTCDANANAGQAPQLTPLRDNAQPQDQLPVYVNWGKYTSSWIAAGLGLSAAW
ncbi:MAG TPA: outer membrane protein transport protein [Kofleriaceae bacterium]|nr:outer membrane protein transport protein [Kofleriaceae bacterium]